MSDRYDPPQDPLVILHDDHEVLLVDKHAIAVGTPDEVLTEDHLIHAFGGRFIRVGDRLILDDPHHHHQH